MKVKNTKKKVIAAILVNILVLSVCFLLYRDIEKRSNFISEVTNELDLEMLKESRYISIKNTITSTEKDREAVDLFFVEEEGMVEFIELIEEQGRISGLSAEILFIDSIKNKKASSTSEIIAVEVETIAKWASIYQFISLLENLPYSITFENVSLRKEEGKVDWKLHLIIHVLKRIN